MKLGVAEQLMDAHRVEGDLEPGREIGLKIDQTLTQDATGTMVYLQFESMGLTRVATELSVSYVDHNTIQDGYENADDHAYLQAVAARYGILFSRAGNGICHQVHLERFSAPGKTLLGSDSHTPTGGGVGMLAMGAGGIDVTLALAGAPFYIEYPRIVRVLLSGALRPWCAAKDVILHLLGRLTTKGNTGRVLEYAGPGLAGLSVPERATIANMGAELGVTTSVFPSDAVTRAFLEAQGRGAAWRELAADEGARCEQTLELDLGSIVPLAAQPHGPDQVASVESLAGLAVDQVAIGSCTNSSYADMMRVARLLKGRQVHPRVSLVIAPGSRQVLAMLAANGALADMVAAGARILEPVCGFCIGNCHAPRSDGVSLRTTNRNFKGRSGTPSARVYLVSPETAVVSALQGVLSDPRAAGLEYPAVTEPATYLQDDRMVLAPPPERERASVAIVRGPNIGAPLSLEPLPDRLAGTVGIKLGDKVTTDDIMPAGSRLKYRSNIPRYAEFVFELVDPSFSRRCRELAAQGRDVVIVGGHSYGQGSSREHAAICPRFLGVKAVLARSFERIHFANLINFGILPLVFERDSDYEAIGAGESIECTGLRAAIRDADRLAARLGSGQSLTLRLNATARQRAILLAGGILRYAAAGQGAGR